MEQTEQMFLTLPILSIRNHFVFITLKIKQNLKVRKSSSVAVRTRRRLVNTSTLVRTAAEDDFVICRNARMDMCLCYQVDV